LARDLVDDLQPRDRGMLRASSSDEEGAMAQLFDREEFGALAGILSATWPR
jgi:hypothetical protein